MEENNNASKEISIAVPTEEPEDEENTPEVSFREFLESIPPMVEVMIPEAFQLDVVNSTISYKPLNALFPQIKLHCYHNECDRPSIFRRMNDSEFTTNPGRSIDVFANYLCSNCRVAQKRFSLGFEIESGSKERYRARAMKYGELPEFGPPIPQKVMKFLGRDRELFFKGRNCEKQGLGIGAFGYYRRVVENQKKKILGEILKVAKKLNADEAMLSEIEHAMNETQFKNAIDSVKPGIPDTLKINGHNPLQLLHTALSDGLHDRDDAHCLEYASSIRVVLYELAEKLDQAIKEDNELNAAVSKLMKIKNKQQA